MKNCKFCGKSLNHIEGRRKKEFCNNTCRSKYWYNKNLKVKQKDDRDNPLINAARGRDENGINKDEVKVVDLTKPNVEKKPFEQPATNYSINTLPKTLDDIKLLCPKELSGFDRSQWIAAERQKYGI